MSVIEKAKQDIIEEIKKTILALKEENKLQVEEIPEFVLEVPREKAHGEFASNIAMLLVKTAKKNPREIAGLIAENFNKENTQVDSIEIAGPGFINFRLKENWLDQVLPSVLQEGEEYGSSDYGQGKKVMIEFVSANPTGLLHMGNARGAALGDSLSNIMSMAGYEVKKEFYINDAGNQIINFGKSLEARYLQELGQDVPFPEEGYHGDDIIDSAKRLVEKFGDSLVDDENAQEKFIEIALNEKIDAIKADLKNFGVEYDNWYNESTLHESGKIDEILEILKKKDLIYENEGALWFKTTSFGEEKDEVIVRSNGIPTYFAADIAYHKDKFDRGFDQLINIWGADHHGHVARMKGAMQAIGENPDNLEVILMQLVRLFRGKDVVRMSKRTGEYVTLNELVDEVGKDAARYFFVMRNPDTHLDFDLELAKQESSDNPVYYIQYAHARICSIIKASGLDEIKTENADMTLLRDETEIDLIRKIADFSTEVINAAKMQEPYRLTNYANELAGTFHSFYNNCQVINKDQKIMNARLVLVESTRITLKNILTLLGVSAPERM